MIWFLIIVSGMGYGMYLDAAKKAYLRSVQADRMGVQLPHQPLNNKD